MYRLVLTCNVAAREGAMQLAWSPHPEGRHAGGGLDGKPRDDVQGRGQGAHGERHAGDHRASGVRVRAVRRHRGSRISCRQRTLTVSELFAGETVTFPFDRADEVRTPGALGLLPLIVLQGGLEPPSSATALARIAATSRPACSFSARYDVSTSRCIAVQSPDRCICSSGTPASTS